MENAQSGNGQAAVQGKILSPAVVQPEARLTTILEGDRHATKQIEPYVEQMRAEMEAARRQGLFGLYRLKFEAWLEERMKDAMICKLQTRQLVLEEQRKTAESEIRLRSTVQSGEREVQKDKIEWNEVNRRRLVSELRGIGMIVDQPAGNGSDRAFHYEGEPPVTPHITDEQIEKAALQALMTGVDSEEELVEYRAELSKLLPPYAVSEVEQRLRHLWRLRRQDAVEA